jgi:hypothetical protein
VCPWGHTTFLPLGASKLGGQKASLQHLPTFPIVPSTVSWLFVRSSMRVSPVGLGPAWSSSQESVVLISSQICSAIAFTP